MTNIIYKNEIIIGILLAMVTVLCNFLSELMPCHLQRVFHTSMIPKHILFFIIIFLTINISNTTFNSLYYENFNNGPNRRFNPLYQLRNTILIYIGFLFFSKSTPLFTYISISLVILYYILYNVQNYYLMHKDHSKDYIDNKINQLEKVNNLIIKVLIINLIIGFVFYTNKQYNEHKKDFSIIKYIFGVMPCDKLK